MNTRNRFGSLPEQVEFPTEVPDLENIVKVSCGYWHMLALDKTGSCWSSGSNKHGELGAKSESHSFSKIETKFKTVDISAGFCVSFFIDNECNLYSCGSATLSLHQSDEF